MQIVIDIPDELYKKQLSSDWTGNYIIHDAIANGIPLPQEHDDLKDIDKIISDGIDKGFCDWYDEMKEADTIIKSNME